jgi:type I restriction enzyme, S subunit
MSEFTHTGIPWVGNIPCDWGMFPLFSIASENKKKNKEKNDNVLSLSYGRIIRRDLSKNFGLLPENFDGYQVVDNGYIIIRSTDLQNDKRSLRVGLVNEYGVITSAYIGLSPSNNVYPNYLFYYLNMCDLKKVFYSLGGGLRQSLRFEEFRRFPIPIPSLAEQKLISRYLDKKTTQIDSLIEKIQRKIELLKEQRTSLINQYVTKGLDTNVEMKDSGVEWIGEIPKHWKFGRFKYYISILTDYTANGSFKALADNVEYLSEGYSRLVRLTDLRKDLRNEGVYVSFSSHNFLKKSELFGNEILIANVGAYTGFSVKMKTGKGTCTLGPNMFLVRNNEEISNVDYVVYLLNSHSTKMEFDLVISSTAQPKINKDNLRGLVVPIPPENEQEEISAVLNETTKSFDCILRKKDKKILLLKEYRQSLISSVVTGKVRVTEDMV